MLWWAADQDSTPLPIAVADGEAQTTASGTGAQERKLLMLFCQHTNALECTDRKRSSPAGFKRDRSDRFLQPVRPVGRRNSRRSRTSSLGGTPSELEDLGLSWSRQTTQDVLERRRDEERTTKGLENLGFEKKVKEIVLIRLWLKNSQSAAAFIFIGRGGLTPSKSGYNRLNHKP